MSAFRINSALWRTCLFLLLSLPGQAIHGQVLGDAIDVSQDFTQSESTYFVPTQVGDFDESAGRGSLRWSRYRREYNVSFNKLDVHFSRAESNEFPATEYDRDPELPLAIDFVSPRTVRLRFSSHAAAPLERPSLMLAGEVPSDKSWQVSQSEDAIVWTGPAGKLVLYKKPWRIEAYDRDGRLLTRTQTLGDPATFSAPMPFSFVRRGRDFSRSMAASFRLAPDEKIFGCGESFTRLDKRGQKIVLFVQDAMGAQSQRMYKPIPFFLSSRGYGMFVHTSAPVTFDFGQDFDQSAVIYSGDEVLDLFLFFGPPKEVLSEYTALTGRSPVPPLWSFGLWMSRITYNAEEQVRDVAQKLREHRIPSDVIHLDTGWFETDWQCDYKFAKSRFSDPAKMIEDLRGQGFRVSLWQLPYFTSKNALFADAAAKGYFVRNAAGKMPFEDGVVDFSNPAAKEWYQGLIEGLLKLGVGAIKVDFGEGAPLDGQFASGATGYYEHNLYPLRYNQTVADFTKQITGEQIIWARSAWAGSQRYPLHWGGDAENTDSSMAATLRAGLSLGLCGFTYWSHDAGGFVEKAPRNLYRRWLAFAALCSQIRCHGAPPREPWEYDAAFEEDFRRTVELRYQLLPYIFAQAKASSQAGHPMIRPLFFESPDDKTSWLIEDEYCFGSDLLVAPLMEDGTGRDVYLPPGGWVDYQTARAYEGGSWHHINAGKVPIVLLVKSGAVIPHAKLAQNTGDLDWTRLELRVFGSDGAMAQGKVAVPNTEVRELKLKRDAKGIFSLTEDAFAGQVEWTITTAKDYSR